MRSVAVVAAAAAAGLLLAGCGGSVHGRRAPTAAERTQIVHWIRFWWRNDEGFAAVRDLHLQLGRIRVSEADPDFATIVVRAVDPTSARAPEPQTIGLMRWGGLWKVVVGPGDWSGTCTEPSPRPLVDLYCPRP